MLARAVYLADLWKKADAAYSVLHMKYQKELRDQLKIRFDRFAILDQWNFGQPERCAFLTTSHNADGSQVLPTIQDITRRELFIPEDLQALITNAATTNRSVGDLMDQLKEPMGGGEPCIPWLGETEAKELITRVCAQGKVTINLLGREMMERNPGETEDDAWLRMRGRLGTGRQLADTTLHQPGSTVSSGGTPPPPSTPGAVNEPPPPSSPAPQSPTQSPLPGGGLFGGGGHQQKLETPPTSALSLLGKLESWGVNAGTPLHNLNLNVSNLTGAQLEKLLKNLPDGLTYGLEVHKEERE